MRKFIIIVISVLLPFGLWTAGCRQERTAAFPTTPEMQALARAPEQNAPTRPPVIPAAPIDRDILNLPETTERRMLAVNDRSRRMAGSQVDPGLFSLPADNGHVASLPEAAPAQGGYGMDQAGMVPIPSGREFWSKPAAPIKTSRPMHAPEGVAAMMPAAPVESFMAPPAPYAAPALPNDPVLMLPEDIPGLFMDSDAGPISFAPRRPAPYGRPEPVNAIGDALGAPPLLSSEAFALVPADDLGRILQEDEPVQAKRPFKLDLVGLLGSMRGMTDTIIPPSGVQSAPVEMAAAPMSGQMIQAMPSPPATVRKPAFDAEEIRAALAPLPDITTQANRSGLPPATVSAPLTMPAPMPEPLPPPDMAAAVATLMDYTPESREEPAKLEARNAAGSRDYFRTDFWERESGETEFAALALDEFGLPKVAEIKLEKSMPVEVLPEFASPQDLVLPLPLPALDEVPEVKFTSPSSAGLVPVRPATEIKEPQKVVLQPIRNRARQAPELERIDSAAVAPPLKF